MWGSHMGFTCEVHMWGSYVGFIRLLQSGTCRPSSLYLRVPETGHELSVVLGKGKGGRPP